MSGRAQHGLSNTIAISLINRFPKKLLTLLEVTVAFTNKYSNTQILCFSPFVVALDLIFQKADILFVNQRVLKERGTPENPIFAFFRSQIHLKIQRMVVYHWIQLFYLATLFLVVQNPDKGSPYLKCVGSIWALPLGEGGAKSCQDGLGHFFLRLPVRHRGEVYKAIWAMPTYTG